MDPDRARDHRRPPAASPATVAVCGMVGLPMSLTASDLLAMATGSRSPQDTRRVIALTDLMSVVMLHRSAELLVATDLSGRSLVMPLRDVLARQRSHLVVETMPGRVAIPRDGPARLDVEGWTWPDEPLWVDELRAITFDDFVMRSRSMAIPWQHDAISENVPTPDALMPRVQCGDRDAFADLYDALAPLVFGVIKRVLRDPAMSEEVTQEVFVEIWTNATRFDAERASVNTWVTTMARRRAVDRVRREQSQRNRMAELRQQPPSTPDQPDTVVVSALDASEVSAALDQLPPDQRQVIELAFLDGLAHGAIAERLQLPLGTVKGRVRGGLKRLRSIMDIQEIGASG